MVTDVSQTGISAEIR